MRNLFILLLLFLLPACFNNANRDKDGLYPYNKSLDREFIIQQVAQDRYWLVADESAAYDVADTLDTGVHGFVKLPVNFFVYYKDKKPAGLISYYIDSPTTAKIQFIDVNKDYRRLGIAEKMVKDIIAQLKEKNIYSVELVVRATNINALKLYQKLGFKYSYDTGKYVYLEYTL